MSCAILAVTAKISIAAAALGAAAQAGSGDGRFSLRSALPGQILIGPQIATSAARLDASREYAALVEPTPATRETWIAPSLGIQISLRWKRWFSLALEPRHESYGLATREQTMAFPGNPFPHTLKARTELSYFTFPLLLGLGWLGPRQHLLFRAGPYVALLDEARLEWTVDGEPYANKPLAEFEGAHTGWLLGLEYGLRMGPGELLMGMEAQPDAGPLMAGLQGSLQARSARVQLGYAWSLKLR